MLEKILSSTIKNFCTPVKYSLQKNYKRNKEHKARTDFISSTLSPLNSPDLNPVDYVVWGILQDLVYRNQIKDAEELHQCVEEEWDSLASDRECNQGMAQETVSLHCS